MSDKPLFTGTKKELVNRAWVLWLEGQTVPEILAQAAHGKTALETGWKLGYMNCLVAFENGAIKRHSNQAN